MDGNTRFRKVKVETKENPTDKIRDQDFLLTVCVELLCIYVIQNVPYVSIMKTVCLMYCFPCRTSYISECCF